MEVWNQINVIAITSSSLYPGFKKENSLSQIYLWSNVYIFDTSPSDSSPWIQYEFNEVKTLKKIILKCRSQYDTMLANAKIEVSLTGTDYDLFYQFDASTQENGDILEISGINGPMQAKFVRISRQQQFVVVANIALIGSN